MVVEKIEKQEMEIAQIVLAISMEKLHTIREEFVYSQSFKNLFVNS